MARTTRTAQRKFPAQYAPSMQFDDMPRYSIAPVLLPHLHDRPLTLNELVAGVVVF